MKFACPLCAQRLEANEELFGREIACPACSGQIVIPFPHYKYWAFLSYSHQDNITVRADGRGDCVRWAEWLHNSLETYRVPFGFADHRMPTGEVMPQRFFPVFQDEKELPINARLGESIRQALEQSRFLIVICSPKSAASRYVNEEVRYFKQMGRGDRILALIVDGEPNASAGAKQGASPELECFCPALIHPIGADGLEDLSSLERQEPIAGDVRVRLAEPVREAFQGDLSKGHLVVMELVKLKLLAGLMGVGFDELIQRDRVRALAEARARKKRIIFLSALFSLVFLTAATAGVVAWQQKRVAQRENQEKEVQRKLALRRQYINEFQQIQAAWEDHNINRIYAGLNATRPVDGNMDLRGWEWYFLHSTLQHPVRTFTFPASIKNLRSVSWSPAGPWLAIGGGGGRGYLPYFSTVQVLDQVSGKTLHTLTEKGSIPVWNSTGDKLAAVVEKGVQVWDLPSGKPVKLIPGDSTQQILSVEWCPTRDHLVIGGCIPSDPKRTSASDIYEGSLQIWDVNQDVPSVDLTWKDKGVFSVAWNPAGTMVAVSWKFSRSALGAYYVSLFDSQNGQEVDRVINADSFTATSMNFGVERMLWKGDGTTIAMARSGGGEIPLDFINIESKRAVMSLDNASEDPTWNSDCSRLLGVTGPIGPYSYSKSCAVKLWEPRNEMLSTVLWFSVPGVGVTWSPDGQTFATLGHIDFSSQDERELSIWRTDQVHRNHVALFPHQKNRSTAIAWSRSGTLMASGSSDGDVNIFDGVSGARKGNAKLHTGDVLGIDWSPDNRALLTVGKDGIANIWSGTSGQSPKVIPMTLRDAACGVWSSDGKQMALGTRSGALVIYSAEDSTKIFELPGDDTALVAIQWHPLYNEMASLDENGRLSLWNLDTKSRVGSVETGHVRARSLAYDPWGKRIATCGDDHQIRIWSVPTLDIEGTLSEHRGKVVSVSWNPVDHRLSSVDDEGVVWLWDTEAFRGVLRLQDTVLGPAESHRPDWLTASQIAWSPDGLRLAACGKDSYLRGSQGIIHIWNATRPSKGDVPQETTP